MFTIYTAIIIGSASVGRAFAHASDIAKARCASTTIPIINTWSQSGEKVRIIKGHHKFSDVHFYYPARLSFPVLRGITLVVKPDGYDTRVGRNGTQLSGYYRKYCFIQLF